MIQRLDIMTRRREELIDISDRIQSLVREAGIQNGECFLFVPHTTAGITINEHADPTVCEDILRHLAKIVPRHGEYAHTEGNSDAHIKASLLGSSARILIENGRLLLGTWQGVFFAEFDGPRVRCVIVKLSAEK